MERCGAMCSLRKRGTGLSDRPTGAATLEERTDDIRAGMDAVGLERAAIYVRDLTAGAALEYESRGLHELKGVPEPRQLLAVGR